MELDRITNASEAQSISNDGQIINIEKALSIIKQEAKNGFKECVLFSTPLSFGGVKKLMELRFAVSEFIHPLEQRKLQRVSW